MKTKTFEDLLIKNASKEDLENLIVMAEREIKAWELFVMACEEKIEEKETEGSEDYAPHCLEMIGRRRGFIKEK